MGHSAERLKCETCGQTYCPKCDSDCPSCCIHRECQRQLKQAQEKLRVERNRAVALNRAHDISTRVLEDQRDVAIERAEAAERDAAEQRALAEARGEAVESLLDIHHSSNHAHLDRTKPASKTGWRNCGAGTCSYFAEALRAKHRTPQSGQKEGN